MCGVDDRRELSARPVWLFVVSVFVSSMVVLVLYHIILSGEFFYVYVAVVAGGSVGAGLSTSGSLHLAG